MATSRSKIALRRYKPTSGEVLLDGVNIWAKPKEIGKIRFRVGLVMQYPEYQLFDDTVITIIQLI